MEKASLEEIYIIINTPPIQKEIDWVINWFVETFKLNPSRVIVDSTDGPIVTIEITYNKFYEHWVVRCTNYIFKNQYENKHIIKIDYNKIKLLSEWKKV